jgi:hypothetical protein
MADLVMLHALLSSEQMADLERFRERAGKRSKKDAARELLQIGLHVAADQEAGNEGPDLSTHAGGFR